MANSLEFEQIFDPGSDIIPPVEFDTTLTQSGKAADAKVVGDRLDVLIGSYTDGLEYTLKDDGTYEVSGRGIRYSTDIDIVIPMIYNGHLVTSIGESVFSNFTIMRRITIPNSITNIGNTAFRGCTGLTSIVIPDSVTNIGSYAFDGCSGLTSVLIPDSVKTIGFNAFAGCQATICCEALSQPGGWNANWNPNNCPVVWGAILNLSGVIDRTVDKITYIDTWYNLVQGVDVSEFGITWEDEFGLEINRTKSINGKIYQKIPIAAGNNVAFEVFNVDGEQVVKINATSGDAGITTTQISITYAELKALRDTAKLIPGMFYRITDYVCTTIQPDTRAMENKFDIIVQALSNNTLSENAKADYHAVGSFFKPEFLADEDGALVRGAVTKYYDIYEDCDTMGNGTIDYKNSDVFVEYGYLENNEGVTVPVLYKSDLDAYPGLGADYNDIFYYVGTYELNGTIYDRWRKIESVDDGEYHWDSTGKIYALTNVIVEGDSANDDYFKNANLPAWELKYSLDNDTTRFAWAMDGQAIINLETYLSNGQPLTRQPSFDGGKLFEEPLNEYYYAWGTQADVDDDDVNNFWYSKNEVLSNGETLIDGDGNPSQAIVVEGKGVIYYMKDEHDNECPYDFKNIQFKRKISLRNGYPELYENINEDDTWVYTFCGNSYHIDNDEWSELKDGSLESPYGHQSDERYSTFRKNIIRPYIELYDRENDNNLLCGKMYLNDNVFFGYWDELDSDSVDEYPYYTAVCCYNNTFGNDCYHNTFNCGCHINVFGDNCYGNIFEGDCYLNTFGHRCSGNIFSKGCRSNVFGAQCNDNTFYPNCNHIIFDSGCFNNNINSNSWLIVFGQNVNNCSVNNRATNINFASNTAYVRLVGDGADRAIENVTIGNGISGMYNNVLELQVPTNSPPVVYEAAGTNHIILDQ